MADKSNRGRWEAGERGDNLEYLDLDGGKCIVEETAPFCVKCGDPIPYPWDKPCQKCFPVGES
jgi:hypothetical protein